MLGQLSFPSQGHSEPTLAGWTRVPKLMKVSNSMRSSTLGSRFPTKRFAPMSSCFRSDEAFGVSYARQPSVP